MRETLPRTAALITALATVGAAAAIATATPAQADSCSFTWTGPAGGDWNVAANWSPARVPGRGGVTCINTQAGPTVSSTETFRSGTLVMNGGTLNLDGQLWLGSYELTDSDVIGAGTITVTGTNGSVQNLDGVLLSGGITLTTSPSIYLTVVVSGSRSMCGGQLSVCLTGTSRIIGARTLIEVGSDVVVGGSTTATPAVSVLALDGGHHARIAVDFSGAVRPCCSSGDSLQLDRWEQLSSAGVFTGSVVSGADPGGQLIAPRTILRVAGGEIRTGVGVLAPNGASALGHLTNVGAGPIVDTPFPVSLTPRGGTLTLAAGSLVTMRAAASSTTLTGTLRADGDRLVVQNDLRVDAFVATGTSTTYPVTTVFSGGSLSSTGRITVRDAALRLSGAASLSAPGGVLIGAQATLGDATSPDLAACASIDGPVTIESGGSLTAKLFRPNPFCSAHFTVAGTVTLRGGLAISSNPGTSQLGDRFVIIDASSIQGHFSSISGQNVGPNHWQIDQSATQVVATLVAGNV